MAPKTNGRQKAQAVSYLRSVRGPDRAHDSLKEALAVMVRQLIERQGLSQTDAGLRLMEHPSQISLVMCGHLRGFSAGRLLEYVLGLGGSVEVLLDSTEPRVKGVGALVIERRPSAGAARRARAS